MSDCEQVGLTDTEIIRAATDALIDLWDGCPADYSLIMLLNERLEQPEREWVGLTDKELDEIWLQGLEDGAVCDPLKVVQEKLKEKNT